MTTYLIFLFFDIFSVNLSLADRQVDAQDPQPLLEDGAPALVQGDLAHVEEPKDVQQILIPDVAQGKAQILALKEINSVLILNSSMKP